MISERKVGAELGTELAVGDTLGFELAVGLELPVGLKLPSGRSSGRSSRTGSRSKFPKTRRSCSKPLQRKEESLPAVQKQPDRTRHTNTGKKIRSDSFSSVGLAAYPYLT